jgi:hypothetical protein
MAESKTSPWLIGGIAIGSLAVLYYLYQEYQTTQANAASAASSAATTATATGSSSGTVESAIPDQVDTGSPSYPSTATVTAQGTVTGTSTAEPTGTPEGTTTASPVTSVAPSAPVFSLPSFGSNPLPNIFAEATSGGSSTGGSTS